MFSVVEKVLTNGAFLSISLGFLVGTSNDNIGAGVFTSIMMGIVNTYIYWIAND